MAPRGRPTGYANAIREHGPAVDGRGTDCRPSTSFVAGVGPDGHILSVFPGSASWDAETLCVGVPAPTHIEPHVDRVTMHPACWSRRRGAWSWSPPGGSKAAVLGRAWTGDDARELPVRAARVGHATWILDEAAAADLPRP